MIIPNSPASIEELLTQLKVHNWQNDLNPVTKWIQQNVASHFSSTKKEDIEEIFARYLHLNQQENLTAMVDKNEENSVVHQAAKFGFDKFLEKCSERLSPEIVNRQSESHRNTALHLAALGGHLSTLELLLDQGADPNIVNKAGKSPIHFAAVSPEKEDGDKVKKECVKLLLMGTTAEVMLKNGQGNPLIFSLINFNDKDLLDKVLTKCPGLMNSLNGQKQNVLHYALIQKSDQAVDYFLGHEKAESLLQKKSGNYSTPLILACRYGGSEAVEKLLQHPVCIETINAADEHKKTALHWACQNNDNDSINLLLTNGAKPDSLDDHHKPPFSLKPL